MTIQFKQIQSLGGDLSGSGASAAVLALETTGAPVVVSGAAPPTNGQVLTATSATTANWQTPSGSATLQTVIDAGGTPGIYVGGTSVSITNNVMNNAGVTIVVNGTGAAIHATNGSGPAGIFDGLVQVNGNILGGADFQVQSNLGGSLHFHNGSATQLTANPSQDLELIAGASFMQLRPSGFINIVAGVSGGINLLNNPENAGLEMSSTGALLVNGANNYIGTLIANSNLNLAPNGTGLTTISSNGLQFLGSTSGFVGHKAQAVAGSATYVWPAAPINGNYLQTDASGNLSWAASSSSIPTLQQVINQGSTFTGGNNIQLVNNNNVNNGPFITINIGGGAGGAPGIQVTPGTGGPSGIWDGPSWMAPGSVSAPGYAFQGSTTTGWYSSGLNQIAAAINGVQTAIWTAASYILAVNQIINLGFGLGFNGATPAANQIFYGTGGGTSVVHVQGPTDTSLKIASAGTNQNIKFITTGTGVVDTTGSTSLIGKNIVVGTNVTAAQAGAGVLVYNAANTLSSGLSLFGLALNSTASVFWTATTNAAAAPETVLARNAIAQLYVQNGTTGDIPTTFGTGGVFLRAGDKFGWATSATDSSTAITTAFTRVANSSVALGNGGASDTSGTLSLRSIVLSGSTSGSTALTVPATASGTYTLPSAPGTTGQVLTASNGTGTLGWTTPTGDVPIVQLGAGTTAASTSSTNYVATTSGGAVILNMPQGSSLTGQKVYRLANIFGANTFTINLFAGDTANGFSTPIVLQPVGTGGVSSATLQYNTAGVWEIYDVVAAGTTSVTSVSPTADPGHINVSASTGAVVISLPAATQVGSSVTVGGAVLTDNTGINRVTSGAAALFTDANTTSITMGGGAANTSINFGTSGSPRWTINSGGHISAGTNNAYDIGTSDGGTTLIQPRTIYVGTSVAAGGTIVYGSTGVNRSSSGSGSLFTDNNTTNIFIGGGSAQSQITIGGGASYVGTNFGKVGVADAFLGNLTVAGTHTSTGAINANGGVQRSTAGAASLFTDANTTSVTIGGGAAHTGVTLGKSGQTDTHLGDALVTGTLKGSTGAALALASQSNQNITISPNGTGATNITGSSSNTTQAALVTQNGTGSGLKVNLTPGNTTSGTYDAITLNGTSFADGGGGGTSSAVYRGLVSKFTVNDTATTRNGHYDALVAEVTETSLGTGASHLIKLSASAAGTFNAGAVQFQISNQGLMGWNITGHAGANIGTPGNTTTPVTYVKVTDVNDLSTVFVPVFQ